MANYGEKSEKPTARRLQKAQREGQFAASKDFVSGLQFTVFVVLLLEAGPKAFAGFREATRALFNQAFRDDLTASSILELVRQSFAHTMFPLAAIGSILAFTALGFQLASTRFSMSLQKLAPKASNFNPISKLKDVPRRGFASAVQAVALLLVFGALLYLLAAKDLNKFLLLPLSSLDVSLQAMRAICFDVLWKASAFFLLFGAIDLFRQKRRFMKQLKMTKHEVREELKETEGNPQIKMRIRRLQRDMRRRRMMAEVKTATAVIVNPTHYAVAIRYLHDSMSTPVVVAKGKNYLAARIRARALEYNVPLIENPPLAQALYKSVEVGQQIPPHLYRAVAEILAYIYRLMGAKVS